MTTVQDKPSKKSFDITKYQISPEGKTKTIEVEGDSFEVKVKPLSWFKRNELMSRCMALVPGGESKFDGALFVREVLKEIIVEAPWGRTTDAFLISINTALGTALEQLVASEAMVDEEVNPEETKKES